MDNNQSDQNIFIRSRESATVSGVCDVTEFDETGIILSTDLGTLAFDGEGMRITRLDLDRKEVDLQGKINGVIYAEKRAKGRKSK